MQHQDKISTRYSLEMFGGFCLYAFVLVLVHRFGFPLHDGIGRSLVLLSPMLPVLLIIAAVVRYFRRVDEYLKLRILENWALTALVTAMATFTYGFLENAGFPKLSMFTVFPLMGVVCAVICFVRRIAGR